MRAWGYGWECLGGPPLSVSLESGWALNPLVFHANIRPTRERASAKCPILPRHSRGPLHAGFYLLGRFVVEALRKIGSKNSVQKRPFKVQAGFFCMVDLKVNFISYLTSSSVSLSGLKWLKFSCYIPNKRNLLPLSPNKQLTQKEIMRGPRDDTVNVG